MAFDWAGYLTLAKELAAQSDEAAQRSAMSRAYYAAYNRARLQLSREGIVVPKQQNSHKELWDIYRNSSDTARQAIGITGDRLREFRRQADYDDFIPHLANYVKVALSNAESLIKALDKL